MKITIIGAGIGGLTTAVALRQAGFETVIFEAAQELKPIGAGIFMWSNAMQIFDRLGIAENVKAAGWEIASAYITDEQLNPITIYDIQKKVTSRYGVGNIAVTRARLQEILLQQIPPGSIHLGKRVHQLERQKDRIRLTFKNGEVHEAELVIAADGIHSVARKSVKGTCAPRYSGQTCWRGISRFALPESMHHRSYEIWGNAAGLRFGFGPVSAKEVYWFCTALAPEGNKDEAGSTTESLRKRYASFAPIVKNLLDETDDTSVVRSDLHDYPKIRHWWQGRLALLGDAAHATTPNLGQGGCQAVEDGWAIAQFLKRHPEPESAFAAYQRYRYAKAKKVIDLSWTFNQMTNIRQSWLRSLRDAMLRAIPGSVNARMVDPIFRIDPIPEFRA